MTGTLSIGEEIGKSGFKVVFFYCYKGTNSNHCTYGVAAVTDAGEDAKNQHGEYKTYESTIARFSWRSSSWGRGARYVDILGDDDRWYRAGVNQDKSLYFSEHGTEFVPPNVQLYVYSNDPTQIFPHIEGLEVYVDGVFIGATKIAYDRRYYSRIITAVMAGRHEIQLKPPKGYRIVSVGRLTSPAYLINAGSFSITLEEYDDPCEGVICDPTCVEYDRYSRKCVDGTCVTDSLIEVNSAECEYVCAEGEKRGPKTCWDGSAIHTEVCRNNAWIPSGKTCPTKPECKEGDKKAGYICEGGKWVAYTPPVVPPVVPPVEPPVTPPVTPPVVPPKYLTPEQANERVRAGLPCYIKCTLPILNMLPAISYTQGAWVLPFFTITSEP